MTDFTSAMARGKLALPGMLTNHLDVGRTPEKLILAEYQREPDRDSWERRSFAGLLLYNPCLRPQCQRESSVSARGWAPVSNIL